MRWDQREIEEIKLDEGLVLHAYKDTVGVLTAGTLPLRLWSKVEIKSENDCWPWKAKAVAHFGYGRLSVSKNKSIKSHRAAWLVTFGPIPDNMCVCHTCDNPKCCNPNHLFLGTKKDNTRDMMTKGRHSPPPVFTRATNPNTKISDLEVKELLSSSLSVSALAKQYNVSSKTIYTIRKQYRKDLSNAVG